MIKRSLRVLSVFGLLPWVGFCVLIVVPVYIITGDNSMEWIEIYVDYMCSGATDKVTELPQFNGPSPPPPPRLQKPGPKTTKATTNTVLPIKTLQTKS